MRSLKSKILVLAVTLVIVTQAITIGVVLYTAGRAEHQSVHDHLLSTGTQLDAGLELTDLAQRPPEERVRQIARLTGLEVALLAGGSNGRMHAIASSTATMNLQSLTTSLQQATEDDHHIAHLIIDGRKYLSLRRTLTDDGARAEVLLLQPLDGTPGFYHALRLATLVPGIILLLLAAAATLMVARSITRPIRRLADATRRMQAGRPGSESSGKGGDDELGRLAAAFDTLQLDLAEREQRISYQTQFDILTGLPNRLLAVEHIAQAIEEARLGGSVVSVLVIDLGNFTSTAATLGHDLGDALLAQAAARLRASVDARHTVARLEADQFLIALNGLGIEKARELADDLLRHLEAGLSVHDVNISLNAAIGLAAYPQHARDADQLLQRATVARDDARSAHQNVHVYEEGREQRRQRQITILGDLRRAVRHDELKLHYQPKLDLAEGRICGAEALVRWEHPALGWLPPGEFIGVAEQFGSIPLITHWALSTAVRDCRLWIEEGMGIPVAVNLSRRDLLDRHLPTFIRDLLRDHDLSPRYLTLEITEEALVRESARTSQVLQQLRDIGARISIDDFGTGYSSLSQIKNLPVDEMKIDRSFVTELPRNSADTAIVAAAIDLAHNLGLEVVAEGVETDAALRWLALRGCETAQGYFISRPLPAELFTTWVQRHEHQHGQAEAQTRILLPAI